jgi:DNA-binding SARP family transcriptional activator
MAQRHDLPRSGVLEGRFFGSGAVWLDGQALLIPVKKTLALLAYLMLEGETSRATLASLFWSDLDEERARRNLRRELHRLRGIGLRDCLDAEGTVVRLTCGLETDLQRFESLLAEGMVQTALDLGRAPLLDGVVLDLADGFHAWLEVRNEALLEARRRARLALAKQLEGLGEVRAALEVHRELLAEDVLQELEHREVMRLHALLGEREAALAQFDR